MKKTSGVIKDQNEKIYKCLQEAIKLKKSEYIEDFNRTLVLYLPYIGEMNLDQCECFLYDEVDQFVKDKIIILLEDPLIRESFVYSNSTEALDLSERWGLDHPWDPESDDPPYPIIDPPGRCIGLAMEQPTLSMTTNEFNVHIKTTYETSPFRFLILEIDFHQPKWVIKEWFEEILKQYWPLSNPPNDAKGRRKRVDDIDDKAHPLKIYKNAS
jgi:hypothetical protein